jgi:hypothetical protein
MASTNQHAPAATSAPKPTRSEVLSNVLTLAMQFSTCVEGFNLIHPHNETDRHQKVALARLGIEQGRLLIWGDAIGISSPPSTIARHMIPSHPGLTNPDPTVPVNFGVRDPRLDESDKNAKIRAALEEIAGRPSNMSREAMMLQYGMKSPKKFVATTYATLDTKRLEAFREKFALLKDLVRQVGVRGSWQRAGSMTMQKWTVRKTDLFDEFVRTVRLEIDGLISLMDVKEQVDRGMKTDIKAMAWHPEITAVVRHDWEKLRLIREAVADDYPEYEETADKALKYISEELREHHLPGVKLTYKPPPPIRRKSSIDREVTKKPIASVNVKPAASADTQPISKAPEKSPVKEKRGSIFSKISRWGKTSTQKTRSKSVPQPSDSSKNDPQRSQSNADAKATFEYTEDLFPPERSKSTSKVPDKRSPLNLDSVLAINTAKNAGSHAPTENHITENQFTEEPDDGAELTTVPTNQTVHMDHSGWENNELSHAETVASMIDRHDMYRDLGRIETKEIRDKSKDAALGY